MLIVVLKDGTAFSIEGGCRILDVGNMTAEDIEAYLGGNLDYSTEYIGDMTLLTLPAYRVRPVSLKD